MNSQDLRKTAVEVNAFFDEGRQVAVWVMHPERCMESRVHTNQDSK